MLIAFEVSCREDDYWDLKNRSLLDLVWNNYPLVVRFKSEGYLTNTTEVYREGCYYLGVSFQVPETVLAEIA